MRRRANWVAVLVALAGLAASIPLIPKERELAFIRFKDRLYDTAREELERRLAAGDLSVSVVRPLAELYLQYADVDSAVLLLERFVAEHPDDLAARRMLGTYYQYGQRPYDYLHNLEQIARRQPSDAVLRELADIYGWTDQPELHIDTLMSLAGRGRARPDELVALARLLASRGRFAEAIDALDRASRLGSAAPDDDELELLTALLIDSGRADEAIDRLAGRRDLRRDPSRAADMARLFHGRGRPELAVRLLEGLVDAERTSGEALATLTRAEVDAGLADRALTRLADRHRAGRLPGEMAATLVDLAVHRGRIDLAIDVGDASGWAALPSPVVAAVVASAAWNGRRDVAEQVIRELGDEFLADHPVLAAELAADRNDVGAALAWIRRADALEKLPDDATPVLATLEQRLGRIDAAYDRLAWAVEARQPSAWTVESFAQLALQTGRAASAAAMLDALRRRDPTAAGAWARVATVAGADAPVRAWLIAGGGRALDVQSLRDVAYAALAARHPDLAVEATRHLVARTQADTDRQLLGRALIEADRPEESLAVLRPIWSTDVEAGVLYQTAVLAAARRSPEACEELRTHGGDWLSSSRLTDAQRGDLARALVGVGESDVGLTALEQLTSADGEMWLPAYLETAREAGADARAASFLDRELGRPDLRPEARTIRLQALVDLDLPDLALPHLREFALERGGTWVFAYDEALQVRRLTDRRLELWRARATQGELSVEDRRVAAFRLLELGDRVAAENAFQTLAADAPASAPDVGQLLHLWGPRPPPSALAWMEARARRASGDERAAWLESLVAAGGHDRVLELFETSGPPAVIDAALFDAYLLALRAAGDRDAVASIIERAVPECRDPERLRMLSRVALAESRQRAAERALAALVDHTPDDLEALRWLGLIASARGDEVGAKWRLESYAAFGGDDPEALLVYGQLLDRAGNALMARQTFERATALLGPVAGAPFDKRRTHAFLLARLGRDADATHELDQLIAERPDDRHLRADYAVWLLEGERREDARRVLGIACSSRLACSLGADVGPVVPAPGGDTVASAAPGRVVDVAIPWPDAPPYRARVDGRELLLTFEEPIRADAPVLLATVPEGWVDRVQAGFDTLLLRAAREVVFSVRREASGPMVSLEAIAAVDPDGDTLGERRLGVLRARWLAAAGHDAQSLQTLAALAASAPDDPTVLTALGALERDIGWTRRSIDTLRRAEATDHSPPGVRELLAVLRDEGAPRLRTEVDTRHVGGEWDATGVATSMSASPADGWHRGARVEVLALDARRVRRPDGSITPVVRNAQRAEAWVGAESHGGWRWKAAVYGGPAALGGGAEATRPQPGGSWEGQLEWRRPFWELVESIADDGTRDRTALTRRQRIGRRGNGWFTLSANRYRVQDASTGTTGLSGGLVFTARRSSPVLALSYGFDKETVRVSDVRVDASGQRFTPVPIVSREIHAPTATVRHDVGRWLSVEGSAGHAFDRLGGHGPIGGLHLRAVRGLFTADIRAERRLYTLETSTATTRVGATLTVRF